MKKSLIFAIALTLSGSAFAGNLEDFKSKSGLASLDTKTIANTEILIPAALQKIDISITKAKNSGYFRFNEEMYICINAAGEKGYNKISISALISRPQRGECADLLNADLKGTDLSDAYLAGAILTGANLSKTDLCGADLTGAKLNEANLSETYLIGANLKKADLSKANLSGSYLSDANLNKANLQEAVLNGADLSTTDLDGANLKKAKYNNMTYLPYSISEEEAKKRGMIKVDTGITKTKHNGYYLQLDGKMRVCKNAAGEEGYNKITAAELIKNPKKGECADLRNANLSGANLQKANLKGANLSEANLDKSNLSKANLNKATLSGAKLYKADLSMANLNMTNLHNANLVKTNMAKANLQEATLRRAYLTRANLNGANLRESDLSEAYMHKTDLKDADLRMSNFKGAILKMTNLKKAKYLQGAKYNNRTQLPFSKDEAYQRGMIKVAN